MPSRYWGGERLSEPPSLGVFERARAETARGNRVGIGMPVLAELHFGVDLMIAAITRTLGDCIVVIKDSDLDAVPGLAVENWSALREESLQNPASRLGTAGPRSRRAIDPADQEDGSSRSRFDGNIIPTKVNDDNFGGG